MTHVLTTRKLLRLLPAGFALPLLAGVLLLPASGADASSKADRCKLRLSAGPVAPGSTIVAAACGFRGRTAVTFSLLRLRQPRRCRSSARVLRVLVSKSDGSIRGRLLIPATTPVGVWVVHASGRMRNGRLSCYRARLTLYAYPLVAGAVGLSRSAAAPRTKFIARVFGFRPRASITFTLRRGGRVKPLGVFRANTRGVLRVRLAVPARIAHGRWIVQAAGKGQDGRQLVLTGVLRV
jgi:hypothetical protein